LTRPKRYALERAFTGTRGARAYLCGNAMFAKTDELLIDTKSSARHGAPRESLMRPKRYALERAFTGTCAP